MNHYSFDEVYVGQKCSFTVEITEERMAMFTALSGDVNPMHVDEEYARSRGFEGRLVYGMLASSFYSTLVGVYLPGEKCLLNKCEADYRRPVYIGDVLTVSGEVVDKRDATRRVRIKGKTVNQAGKTVNTAEITVGFTGEQQ